MPRTTTRRGPNATRAATASTESLRRRSGCRRSARCLQDVPFEISEDLPVRVEVLSDDTSTYSQRAWLSRNGASRAARAVRGVDLEPVPLTRLVFASRKSVHA